MPPVRSTPARRARRLHLPSRDLRFDRTAQKRRGTDDEPREGARTGDNGKEGRKSQTSPRGGHVLALRDGSPRCGARGAGRVPAPPARGRFPIDRRPAHATRAEAEPHRVPGRTGPPDRKPSTRIVELCAVTPLAFSPPGACCRMRSIATSASERPGSRARLGVSAVLSQPLSQPDFDARLEVEASAHRVAARAEPGSQACHRRAGRLQAPRRSFRRRPSTSRPRARPSPPLGVSARLPHSYVSDLERIALRVSTRTRTARYFCSFAVPA